MRRIVQTLIFLTLTVSAAAQATRPAWVVRSDLNAKLLLDITARFEPEDAAALGVNGLDNDIVDLTPGYENRRRDAIAGAITELRKRLESENDPDVRLDLKVLIDSAERGVRGDRLERRFQLPYVHIAETIFFGLRGLLDDQADAARRPAALVRLRKYAGAEAGYEPLAKLVQRHLQEKLADGSLQGPVRDGLETDLAHDAQIIAEIGPLFVKYNIAGYEPALEKLKGEIGEYDEFVRANVLRRSRKDFRLPPELYAWRLEDYGIDMSPAELRGRAAACFRETQNEMESLAPLVSKENGFDVRGHRDVIRELKKRQVTGDAVKPHFEARIKTIEEIIRREKVVTLPARPMRFRIASAAENAIMPAPHFDPPRLIGNIGEQGEFVLPLEIPRKDGEKALPLDDYSYDAFGWTLTAHEGRPGHDLQFAALAENGVSLARAVYASNSVNIEGWALYCEAEMMPYWPLEGQLATLQARLLREARAFLDPGLQDGTITREEALRVLRNDVCLSEGAALQEMERYTFRAPGQAAAYFCGYQRLMELRADAERAMGTRFDRRRYHDFLLSLGLLPPKLLREAVMTQFVKHP